MIRYTRPLIYFVEHNDSELEVSLDVLTILSSNAAVIIWKNQGAFKLFSQGKIHHHWARAQTAIKQMKFYSRNNPPRNPFVWGHGLDISQEVVEELQSEDFTDHVLNALKEHSPPQ